MSDLSSKRYLVTGATGLLGGAVAQAIASSGGTVWGTYYKNKTRIFKDESVTQWLMCNFAAPEAVQMLVANVGKLDGFVHCSGINKPGPLFEVDDLDALEVMTVNLYGSFLAAKYLLPKLIKKSGAAVFIGSSSAYTGGPTSVHYAASKSGLEGLIKGAAKAIAPYARVNLLHPGYIESPMASGGMMATNVRKTAESALLGRLGRPEEVARVAVWLLSSESSFVNGQVIHTDGGLII